MAARDLAPELGRWPTGDEVALHCDISPDEVRAAMRLGQAERVQFLDESVDLGDGRVAFVDLIGDEDPEFDLTLDRVSIQSALDTLGHREREVVKLRFYAGMYQAETARRIGVSQMHVSRLERAAVGKLRLLLVSDDGGREPRPIRQRRPPGQAAHGALQQSGYSLPA